MRRLLFLALASALASPGAWALDCPQPLRIGFSDSSFPPMINGPGPGFSDPPGWALQAMRVAAQRLGCDIEPQRMPGRRMSLLVEQGELEFVLFFGATAERLKAMRFPLDAAGRPDASVAPLMGHLVFYTLPGSPLARGGPGWDGTTLSPGLRVGAVVGTAQEQLARERGWRMETSSTFAGALQMLQAHRFDVLLSTRETLTPEMRGIDLVEVTPIVHYQPYFVPASPRLWATHADFVRAFWREACLAVRRVAPEARPVDCGVVPAAPRR
ncbi:substrate-binding periplasmic protein [Roseateles sp. NT4]|uniref:substrate-binding periplasmic protein n=1 Tax=Roseateles sp. NT4 TaxID=3453715 RepID=UPI003EEF0168